jgi:hypothetical protein
MPLDNITEAKMSLVDGASHHLSMSMNVNHSFYDIFADQNSMDVGIRVTQIDNDGNTVFDMPFIRDRQAQINRANGTLELSFLSSSYLLSMTSIRKLPYYTVNTGSVFTMLQATAPDVTFQLVGSDATTTEQTGILTNYDLVDTFCKKVNWSWLDAGISGGKSLIQVGQFGDNLAQYNVNYREQDSVFEEDITLAGIPKTNFNGNVFTHLLVLGSSGGSADASSSILFTQGSYSFVDNINFPLESLGTVDTNGRTLYWLVNKRLYDKLGTKILGNYTIDFSSNSFGTSGAIIDTATGIQTAYNRAVAYLKTTGLGVSYSFDFNMKRIVLPLTKVKVSYESIVQTFEGEKNPMVLRDQEIILKNLEYNLMNYA